MWSGFFSPVPEVIPRHCIERHNNSIFSSTAKSIKDIFVCTLQTMMEDGTFVTFSNILGFCYRESR